MNKKITREIILYVLFGVLTTLINFLSYSLLYYSLKIGNTPSTIIAWAMSVLFAYVTNRLYVFESKNNNKFKETAEFFLCRTATGVLDVLIMYVGVDLLLQNGQLIKILSNVLVIVLNYIASKIYIFKKH